MKDPDRVRGIKKITFEVGDIQAWAAWLKSQSVVIVSDVQQATTFAGTSLIVRDDDGNWVPLTEITRR